MPEISNFPAGSFCWCECATTDQVAGKNFYSQLFGWGIMDMPMGPDAFYTMFTLKDKHVAALYGMDSAQLERGVPPHWNVYVMVDNVDASTEKAKLLGGTALMEPFDVMDAGRMSIVQDPTGAIISLWQKGNHTGAGIQDEAGAFCWYELSTADADTAKTFYTNLFGWTTGGGAEYTEWQIDGKSIGGMMQMTDVPPNWLPYIMVADIDATVSNALELGAKLIVQGPAGEFGRFAVLFDPQNAAFAVFQSLRG